MESPFLPVHGAPGLKAASRGKTSLSSPLCSPQSLLEAGFWPEKPSFPTDVETLTVTHPPRKSAVPQLLLTSEKSGVAPVLAP